MILHSIKLAIRNLRSNKSFALINILSFSFALTIALSIWLFLAKEYSYDKYHSNADEIIRIHDAKSNCCQIDYRVDDMLQQNFPEVENVVQMQFMKHEIDVRGEDKFQKCNNLLSVNPDFFKVFSVEVLKGNAEHVFNDFNSIVITESLAAKLFNSEDIIGREVNVMNELSLNVSAVIKDFPDNSCFRADLLINSDNPNFKFYRSCENSRDSASYRYPCAIYVQTKEGVEHDDFISKLNSNINILQPYIDSIDYMKLTDLYLYDDIQESETINGNLKMIHIFLSIGIIILLLAIINYINMMIAQQFKKAKNTAIHKTVGSRKRDLVALFLSESLIIILSSFIIAIIVTSAILPFFINIFNTDLSLSSLIGFREILCFAGFLLIIATISGLGPAIFISKFPVVKILKGYVFTNNNKFYLRKTLISFQFISSIFLTICIIVIIQQIGFVKHKELGFNQDQFLKIQGIHLNEEDHSNFPLYIEKLRMSPWVKEMSSGQGHPGYINVTMGAREDDTTKSIIAQCLLVDGNFINTFQVGIVLGRNFTEIDKNKSCLINEAYYHHFEYDNLENKKFNNNGGYDIVGVVNDFHYNSMHNKIEPMVILFSNRFPNTLSIRFEPENVSNLLAYAKTTWDEMFPNSLFYYEFYDKYFQAMYQKEERFAKAIAIFALFALLISSIGVLGLSIFSAERRIKEIGIRKTNGASIKQILFLLNKDILKLLAIASIVAVPLSIYAMNIWLQDFAYKTPLSWWIFILAIFICTTITLSTLSFQSWKAAKRNPVKSLRYE